MKFTRKEAEDQIESMFNIDISELESVEIFQIIGILQNIDYENE